MADVSTNRTESDLIEISGLMFGALDCWPWHAAGPMRDLVEQQLRQPGKRLRPRLGLIVADLLGGRREVVYPAVAGVEFYHAASLILDDIQDGSAVRHGDRSLHTVIGAPLAINVAATIRSLSYHAIHRSGLLRDGQKAEIHRRLDTAATFLLLGQSIDLGWTAGWYRSGARYPYEEMAAWKTGSLFGCAASAAAVACGASAELVDAAEHLGTAFGVLYQIIDDYRDAFGDGCTDAPAGGDIAEGRPGYPEIVLYRLEEAVAALDPTADARASYGNDERGHSHSRADVRGRMAGLGVLETVRRHILHAARLLVEEARGLHPNDTGMAELVGSALALIGLDEPTLFEPAPRRGL